MWLERDILRIQPTLPPQSHRLRITVNVRRRRRKAWRGPVEKNRRSLRCRHRPDFLALSLLVRCLEPCWRWAFWSCLRGRSCFGWGRKPIPHSGRFEGATEGAPGSLDVSRWRPKGRERGYHCCLASTHVWTLASFSFLEAQKTATNGAGNGY